MDFSDNPTLSLWEYEHPYHREDRKVLLLWTLVQRSYRQTRERVTVDPNQRGVEHIVCALWSGRAKASGHFVR